MQPRRRLAALKRVRDGLANLWHWTSLLENRSELQSKQVLCGRSMLYMKYIIKSDQTTKDYMSHQTGRIYDADSHIIESRGWLDELCD